MRIPRIRPIAARSAITTETFAAIGGAIITASGGAARVAKYLAACSAIAFFCALLAGCGDLPWMEAHGGSATETTGGAKVTGQLVYPDGSSAVGASVVIRPADYLADTSGAADTIFRAEAVVGRDGSYAFKKVPSGEYVLEATDASGRNAMAEFRKDTETGALTRKADTLRAPGILYGVLGAMDASPGAGFAQIFGLGRTVRVDASGAYRFHGVPSGRLRVRAVSSKAHWRFRDTVTATVLPADSTLVNPFIPEFDEDYSAWGSSFSFFLNTLDKTKGVDVYDFPLLVRLTSSNFDFRETDGKDIRFADGNGRHLAYAVEQWDSAAGTASLWVKLDTVKAQRTDQMIRMLWNRPGAPDKSDPHTVFASFSGVWHLSDAIGPDGSGSFKDASPSDADGTGKVLAGQSDGQIGLGRAFRGAEVIQAKAGPTLRPPYGLCISAWVRIQGFDSLGGEIATLGGNYGLRAEPSGKVLFYLNVAGNPIRDKWKLEVGDMGTVGPLGTDWHLITGTYDGFNMRVFLDGNEAMSTGDSFNTLVYPLGQDFRIGSHGQDSAGYRFNGSIDEVQVSPNVRAPSWIRLSWENQKDGSTLIEFR